jgi:hypothetical protein
MFWKNMQSNLRRLHSRGPQSRGLVVDHHGAMVGPDCVLVRRTANGFRCLNREEADAVQQIAFRGQRADWLFDFSCRVAKALNAGEIAVAQIYGVHASPLGELESEQVAQLASAATIVKAGYNPDEPRDWHGRWTTGGDTADTQVAETKSERKNRCIDQCWGILLLKKPYRCSDTNLVEFQRCVDDCMKEAG